MAKEKKLIIEFELGLYKIRYEGGGQLPEKLSGLWISREQAQFQIDMYLDKKAQKKDGKGKS